jgi:hypothetical protein
LIMSVPEVVLIAKRSRDEALFFRVRYNEHLGLTRLLAERRLKADGLVLDARCDERHKILRQEANRAAIATCLDTQAMELALPGTTSAAHSELPWAQKLPHRIEDFTAAYSTAFIGKIAAHAVDGEYSSVLSPAHYVMEEGGAWLDVDADLAARLRNKLDALGARHIQITYPLALPSRLFYDAAFRAFVRAKLKPLPLKAISLRIHPFGSSSGPNVMRHFIEACTDLRTLNVPLIIERAGFSAIAAYALGAAEMVETGITYGDSFDVNTLLKRPPGKTKSSFPLPKRIYLEALGTTVALDIAQQLLNSSPGKLRFACKDLGCCANGFRDMLNDPYRHSTLARQRQFKELSRVPSTMRAEYFINSVLTPACDALSRAGDVHEPFKEAHRRMLSVKETLVDLHRIQERTRRRPVSMPIAPSTRPASQVLTFTPREPRGR